MRAHRRTLDGWQRYRWKQRRSWKTTRVLTKKFYRVKGRLCYKIVNCFDKQKFTSARTIFAHTVNPKRQAITIVHVYTLFRS